MAESLGKEIRINWKCKHSWKHLGLLILTVSFSGRLSWRYSVAALFSPIFVKSFHLLANGKKMWNSGQFHWNTCDKHTQLRGKSKSSNQSGKKYYFICFIWLPSAGFCLGEYKEMAVLWTHCFAFNPVGINARLCTALAIYQWRVGHSKSKRNYYNKKD